MRRVVQFKRHNLQHASHGFPYDFVFLRNVMIYFDETSKANVVRNVSARLKPGGYLLVGGAESLPHARDEFVLLQPTIYRKKAHE